MAFKWGKQIHCYWGKIDLHKKELSKYHKSFLIFSFHRKSINRNKIVIIWNILLQCSIYKQKLVLLVVMLLCNIVCCNVTLQVWLLLLLAVDKRLIKLSVRNGFQILQTIHEWLNLFSSKTQIQLFFVGE